MNQEDRKKQRRKEIIHSSFIKKGTMVAFPLCLPGASVAIPADESYITALDTGPDNFVYGGTSGTKCHLFVGMFHASLGGVFDMGIPENATDCPAVCCGNKNVAACVNSPSQGRIIARKLHDEPDQLIQEWGFIREPLEEWGSPKENEKIIHAVRDAKRETMFGITPSCIFSVNLETGAIEIKEELPGRGRIFMDPKGTVWGKDEQNTLWRFDTTKDALERQAIALPEGSWKNSPYQWSRNPEKARTVYTVDDDGALFSFDSNKGFTKCGGKIPYAPAKSLVQGLDGRLFGFCGEDMAHFFIYYPESREIEKHGVAVSFLERRRYGYVWGDATIGKDGQIFFGENDALGHLWIYFPAIC